MLPRKVLCTFLVLTCPAVVVSAGVFLDTVDCINVPASSNFCVQGMTRDGQVVTTLGITHPMGFDGVGGALALDVCVLPGMDPDNPNLVEPTKKAIRIWNDLLATTRQCRNCTLLEDPDPPQAPDPIHAASVILHELGHCGLGLDHPNLRFDPPGAPDQRVNTSFTMSYDGSSVGISEGPDGIRGSFDDVQQAGGGMIPESVHWFRRSDNNPVIVDGTTIDISTYSRSIPNLPTGHSWSANANRDVAKSLGFEDTQTVMYSTLFRTQRYEGLSADDVNMVQMGKTGSDRMAGTSDDYTISLQFVDDCTGADIAVTFATIPGGSLGGCTADVVHSFPPSNPALALHYSVVPNNPKVSFLLVLLNTDLEPWDFGVVDVVFSDGFESGDFSEWDQVIP